MLEVNFTQNDTRYRLSHTLLFYQSDRTTIATLHEVKNRKLLHGKCLEPADIEDLFHSADQRQRMTMMPQQLIAWSRTEVLWFEKSRICPIYFNVPKSEKRRLFLNQISGKPVIWPNLLFRIRENEISCWCVKRALKPVGNTKLYRAPFTNIFNNHNFCPPHELQRIPFSNIIDYAPLAVEMFYRGHFSHLYRDMEKRISHPRGLDRFWADMAKKVERGTIKTFPNRYLMPTKLTVRSILS